VREIRSVIGRLYGADAVPDSPRMYKTKSKNAQEAHEAIRPTSAARTPSSSRANSTPTSTGSTRSSGAAQSRARWRLRCSTRLRWISPPAAATRCVPTFDALSPGFLAVYRESFDDVTLDDEDDRGCLRSSRVIA